MSSRLPHTCGRPNAMVMPHGDAGDAAVVALTGIAAGELLTTSYFQHSSMSTCARLV
jgi:hypothetical protein